MSRTDPQYRFRPPPELAAKLDEYCQRERRRSVNEALIVLVSDALERWRPSQLAGATHASASIVCRLLGEMGTCCLGLGHEAAHITAGGYKWSTPQCALAPACVEPDGHAGPHILVPRY